MSILELTMKFLRGALNFIFEILGAAIDGAGKAPPEPEESEDFKYNWRTGTYDMGEDPTGWYDDD